MSGVFFAGRSVLVIYLVGDVQTTHFGHQLHFQFQFQFPFPLRLKLPFRLRLRLVKKSQKLRLQTVGLILILVLMGRLHLMTRTAGVLTGDFFRGSLSPFVGHVPPDGIPVPVFVPVPIWITETAPGFPGERTIPRLRKQRLFLFFYFCYF
jgi:hypothetical protein